VARIGIMQGRLVPSYDGRIQCFPRERWAEEFSLAPQAGLDCVEWLYDLHDAAVNPLATDGGVRDIRALADRHAVTIESLCAHCFVEQPLVGIHGAPNTGAVDLFSWLLQRASLLGVRSLVLPLEDASQIQTEADLERTAAMFSSMLSLAEKVGIEIDLETTLPPRRLAALLDRVPHALLRVNYDSGNSAGLGYGVQEEFAAYGARVGRVHVKDKIRGGGTVPLGSGDADFAALGTCLAGLACTGSFVLEVARGKPGDEVSYARHNRDFIRTHILGIE